MNAIRQKAAELGSTALIIIRHEEPGHFELSVFCDSSDDISREPVLFSASTVVIGHPTNPTFSRFGGVLQSNNVTYGIMSAHVFLGFPHSLPVFFPLRNLGETTGYYSECLNVSSQLSECRYTRSIVYKRSGIFEDVGPCRS